MYGPRALLGAAVATAAVVVAVWNGCSSSSDDGSRRGTGGAGGGASDGAHDVAAVDDGSSADDGGRACSLAGWAVHSNLPADCRGLCVPDDVALRVPRHVWVPRDDLCIGCRVLETPWAAPAHDGLPSIGVSGAVVADGPEAEYHNLDMIRPTDMIVAVFHGDDPAAAFRIDHQVSCGRVYPAFSSDGELALNLFQWVEDSQQTLVRPLGKVGELMGAVAPRFRWPKEFIAQHVPDTLSLSGSAVVESLQGRVGIGVIATQTASWFDALAGLAPGQYGDGFVVQDAVFASRFDSVRTEWWVTTIGQTSAVRLIGGDGLDIDDLVATPEWLVWTQGSDPAPEPNASGRQLSKRWDLYRARFTTNPAKLVPELLVPDIQPVGVAKLTNGWFVGTMTPMVAGSDEGTLLAVHVSDGRALKSALPAPYAWGQLSYVTTTEVWGGLDRHDGIPGADTIVRMPLSAMAVVQASRDGG